MKLVCSKQDLFSALSTTVKAVNSNIQKSIYGCVLLETIGDFAYLRATDTMLAIKTRLNAEISENGKCAIPARVFHDLTAKLPDDDIMIETSDNTAIIRCRSFQTTLMTMDSDEFPDFPYIEQGKSVFLPASEFKKMADGTVFSVYLREDKPLLTGEFIECADNKINFVALDGIRIAKRSMSVDFSGSLKAIVPARSLREITKIIGDCSELAELSFGEKALTATVGSTEIYTRLLDGDYIDYNKFISRTYTSRVRIETALLKSALDRISVIARERDENPINVDVVSDEIIITASSDSGEVKEEIPILLEGEGVEMSFNSKLINDVLKCVDDSEMMLEFGGNLKPLVLKPVDGDDYIYLIVPRIR